MRLRKLQSSTAKRKIASSITREASSDMEKSFNRWQGGAASACYDGGGRQRGCYGTTSRGEPAAGVEVRRCGGARDMRAGSGSGGEETRGSSWERGRRRPIPARTLFSFPDPSVGVIQQSLLFCAGHIQRPGGDRPSVWAGAPAQITAH